MERRICLPENPTCYQKILAIELAAILGFELESVKFPILDPCGDIVILPAGESCPAGAVRRSGKSFVYVADSRTSVDCVCRSILAHPEQILDRAGSRRECPQPAGYQAAPVHDGVQENRKLRPHAGLESFFEHGCFLADEDQDWLADHVLVRILADRSLSVSQTVAAANLAARIGAETVTLTYPLTVESESGPSPLIRFSSEGAPGVSVGGEGRRIVTVQGDGVPLEQFSSAFCNSFPQTVPGRTWTDFIRDFEKGLAFQSLDGQLSRLEESGAQNAECFFSPGAAEDTRLSQRFPHALFYNYKGREKVFEETYDLPWEVDCCRRLLEEKVYPQLKAGDDVDIQIILSEDRTRRDMLAAEITGRLDRIGAAARHVDILCAYKQGFCWIDEKVLPALERCEQRPADIEIAFRPFLPSDGAQWLDLPTRYLHELYPIDDIIAGRLKISRDVIRFVEYIGDQDVTYTFRAVSAAGAELFAGSYRASFSERPYMDEFPEAGLVHPSTGAIRAAVNGQPVFSGRIPTDLETIWDVYQSRVLPFCRDYIALQCGGRPEQSMQPFFSQLRLEIGISEPDFLLPCRQDMVSSLDAFHEDLYFVGLDFFSRYGKQAGGDCLDAPGLILPIIHQITGKPTMTFTLFRQLRQSPALLIEGIPSPRPPAGKAYLRALRSGACGMEAVINILSDGDLTGYLASYARLLEEGILLAAGQLEGFARIALELNGQPAASARIPARPQEPPLDMDDIDLMPGRLIGYDEYLAIIEQLRRVPGIAVYEAGESYLGRKIHAIELLPSCSQFKSRLKRIQCNPTKLIDARHHANEISATNGCFLLLRELLKNPRYQHIGDRLNIILIPLENPDGAAIHYALQKEHPHWKFHIARFNALGKEFAGEYFLDETIHTEALAYTGVYRKWLPDLVVENHGVPSHEWDQQFSGYTAPMYRDFWLPRALIYGYFWIIDHPAYAMNRQLNDQMEDAVAQALLDDPEVMRINRDWRDRFEKYAHQWRPDLFSAAYYKGMISYKYPFPYRPKGYVSIRYPWLTAVNFVSEVSDETAGGDYLELCTRTHLIHDLATTDLLLTSRCVYQHSLTLQDGELHKTCRRLRPFLLPEAPCI